MPHAPRHVHLNNPLPVWWSKFWCWKHWSEVKSFAKLNCFFSFSAFLGLKTKTNCRNFQNWGKTWGIFAFITVARAWEPEVSRGLWGEDDHWTYQDPGIKLKDMLVFLRQFMGEIWPSTWDDYISQSFVNNGIVYIISLSTHAAFSSWVSR